MRNKLALYLDLIRFDRPAGWLLLLWPTLTALWIASGGWPGWHLLLVFVLGTILMRSAGCCINDVADRDFDRYVKRTAQRPITSGQLSVREALLAGAVLALVAFALALTTNWLVVLCSVPALLITITYPFAKRYVAMPQAVLGVAFGMGIPMAFAAVQQHIPVVTACWMMLANLFWTLAYDTEYAMVDRDDDLTIGMKTSAITLGHHDVAAVMLFYVLHTIIWWTLLWIVAAAHPGVTSTVIWLIGLLAVLAQIVWHWRLIRGRMRDGCFAAFRHNHWIGFCVWLTTVVLLYLS